MSPSRIALGASLLVLVGTVAFLFAGRRPALPPEPSPVNSPSMDIADADTRAALAILRNEHGVFNGHWLGEQCRRGSRESYEFSRADYGNWTMQRSRFQLEGTGGRVYFDVQKMSPTPDLRLRLNWPLDAAAVAELRRLLRRSGYPTLRAGEPQDTVCHSATVTVESCIGGRYYGLVRRCEGMFDDEFRPVGSLVDGVDALVAQVSGGETGRQAAAVASLRRPAY